MSAQSVKERFAREVADLECRLRFVTCRVSEWRQYGSPEDQVACRDFRKYLCEEVEKVIMADVNLSDTLIRRCEDASHRVPQTWANLQPINVIVKRLDQHVSAGGRHLEIWREDAVTLSAEYVEPSYVEALLDMVMDDASTLLQRLAELRTLEAEIRGTVGTADDPLGLSLVTIRPAKRTRIGLACTHDATSISSWTACHTFQAPRRARPVEP
ncbi:hypothetical protein PENSPDRAFT_651892 [Peniophora sp. CONT]|nr:hypothetical protein PENSPDRAFT_651892 [Peniophora sp. CONT]